MELVISYREKVIASLIFWGYAIISRGYILGIRRYGREENLEKLMTLRLRNIIFWVILGCFILWIREALLRRRINEEESRCIYRPKYRMVKSIIFVFVFMAFAFFVIKQYVLGAFICVFLGLIFFPSFVSQEIWENNRQLMINGIIYDYNKIQKIKKRPMYGIGLLIDGEKHLVTIVSKKRYIILCKHLQKHTDLEIPFI